MKASKILLRSYCSICGVVVGQENRLDVTNPRTERFFKNLKNRHAVGVWYRLSITQKYFTDQIFSSPLGTQRQVHSTPKHKSTRHPNTSPLGTQRQVHLVPKHKSTWYPTQVHLVSKHKTDLKPKSKFACFNLRTLFCLFKINFGP